MATVTQSIGTTGRDHSTITLWEADLDDDPTYDAGDDAVGECYDDSAFDEDVVINGGATINLASIKLTAASAEEHDGTAGTGVRIERSVNATTTINMPGARTTTVNAIEITSTGGTHNLAGVQISGVTGQETHTASRLLVHGMHTDLGSTAAKGIITSTSIVQQVLNCIVYAIDYDGDSDSQVLEGMSLGGTTKTSYFRNNTVFDVTNNRGTSTALVNGIGFADDAQFNIQNNISCGTGSAGSGAAQDYELAAPSNAVVDHNLASDTSASGTGSLDSKAAADQFVSTTGGSEDLHLKSGADAIGAGTDFGTTPSGVEIDIDGRDRDAAGDTWDMGAHEFVGLTISIPSIGTPP